MELDPGDADILVLASQLALSQGRSEEARQLAQNAVVRDTLGVRTYRQLGSANYFAGKLAEAEAAFRKAIDLNPAGDGLRYKLALVLLSGGDAQGALAELEREPHTGWRQQGLPLALDALGRKTEADRAIALAEKIGAEGWAYQLAVIYAHRKSLDPAFTWLNRANAALKEIEFC